MSGFFSPLNLITTALSVASGNPELVAAETAAPEAVIGSTGEIGPALLASDALGTSATTGNLIGTLGASGLTNTAMDASIGSQVAPNFLTSGYNAADVTPYVQATEGAATTNAGLPYNALNTPSQTGLSPITSPANAATPLYTPPSATAPATSGSGGIMDSAGNALQKGFNSFSQGLSNFMDDPVAYAKAHPIMTAMGAYEGLKYLNQQPTYQPPAKYSGSLSKISRDPNAPATIPTPTVFHPVYAAEGGIMSYAPGGQAMSTSPLDGKAMGANQNQMYPQSQQEHTYFATPTQMPTSAEVVGSDYDPKTDAYTGVATQPMASGGIASYAFGSTTKDKTIDPYQEMISAYQNRISPKAKEFTNPDVGIFTDTDSDTRNLEAPQAAMMRMQKLNTALGMTNQPTRLAAQPALGTGLNFNPVLAQAQQQAKEAAAGGIMGYNLGGYATGGNPRLLKGPGDGMSDNIPATIADRQPARLADGEFVVPADVVSHLGNGSTDAGAKKLHTMMDRVRVARTGKKAQGKEINPDKYMPA